MQLLTIFLVLIALVGLAIGIFHLLKLLSSFSFGLGNMDYLIDNKFKGGWYDETTSIRGMSQRIKSLESSEKILLEHISKLFKEIESLKELKAK